MKKFFAIILGIALITLTPSTSYAKSIKKMSQLELREMQTRFYETSDTNRVMKATINTLQDSGFIIQEIESDIGYIRARKIFKHRYINKGRLIGNSLYLALMTAYAVFSYGATTYSMLDPTLKISNELQDKTMVVDTNVNIEKFGKNKTKVRFVLVEKVLQNADGYSFVKSAPTRVIRIYTPKVYEEFFAQVDKNIFYEGI